MRFFAVIDVEVVNLMRKKVEIDLIWFVAADYLRCELHNCSNWTRCSVFTSVATDTSDHSPISLATLKLLNRITTLQNWFLHLQYTDVKI